METRANYVVTGAFTLAVIAGVFGFIFWFQNTGSGGERASYRVVFTGSVSGLRTGASVLFNGIRVGEVSGLALDAHDPRKVVATISVERAVPVRADTKVALAYQGLTGLAEVALTGGAAGRGAPCRRRAAAPSTLYAACGRRRRRDAGGARRSLPHRRPCRRERDGAAQLAAQYRDRDLDAGAEFATARQGYGRTRKPHRQRRQPWRDRPGRGRDCASSRKISTGAPTRSPPGSRAFPIPASRSSRPSPLMAAVRSPS